ncbi:MAG: 50S ribosomal protein L5 [archaeon]
MKAKQAIVANKVLKSEGHIMRHIKIEKVVLSSGATGDNLVKANKLLGIISGAKAQIVASQKRIPDFGVSPGMEVGTSVTLRGAHAIELLKRLLGAIDNQLKVRQVSENHFSFGIKEYIDIPGLKYQRDIGIRGLNVTVVFQRPGFRVKLKKIKTGAVPRRQYVHKDEIIKYMGEHFSTQFN